MKTSSQIMYEARRALDNKWGNLIVASLIYFIIMSAASMTYIGSAIIYGPMAMGFVMITYASFLNEKSELNLLFSGFNNFVNTFLLGLLISIFVFLWSLLLIVPGIIAAIRYSMAFYILRENPQMDAMTALNRSIQMMDGNKMRFFMLMLNFAGWYILCILSCGIGFLFLAPYIVTAKIIFYEELKATQNNAF